MKPQIALTLDVLTKGYVALAGAYSLYIWSVGPFSGPRSGRIAIAVVAFVLCALLAERFTENQHAVPLLKALGVLGVTIMLMVLHQQGGQ